MELEGSSSEEEEEEGDEAGSAQASHFFQLAKAQYEQLLAQDPANDKIRLRYQRLLQDNNATPGNSASAAAKPHWGPINATANEQIT